jgi:N-acetylneuraminate synthase
MSVLVIAEAGVNHNGDLGMALKLVEEAARAGADAVKFQTFKAEKVAAAGAAKAAYQLAATGGGESQLDMLRRLELAPAAHDVLRDRCRALGIEFLSTAFDVDSLRLLVDHIGIGRIKVPSGEVTNGPLMAAMAATGLPVILSTGMCDMGDIRRALAVFASVWVDGAPPIDADDVDIARPALAAALAARMVLLHCTTEYPAPLDEINLRAMDDLRRTFGLPVGLSDHSEGIVVPVASVALGATIVEKHFTLDRTLPGPDHRASLEPDELARMVTEIRMVERALGSAVKAPTAAELGNRDIARRSVVAARPIAIGEVFSLDNLGAKRPGNGLSPLLTWSLVGRVARRAYAEDEMIAAEELS